MRMERLARVVALMTVLVLVGAACGDDAPESRSFEAGDDAEEGSDEGSGEDRPLLVSPTGNEPSDAFQDTYAASEQDFLKKAKRSPGFKPPILPKTGPPAAKPAPTIKTARYTLTPPTSGFYGITRSMTSYVNDDGSSSKKCCNCGQAAAASVLNYWNYNTLGNNIVSYLDSTPGYLPDIAWGAFGTWPNTVRKILLDKTPSPWKAEWYAGEAAMKTWLRMGWPVIVLVDTGPLGRPWGGHYMVVVGYTSTRYYVTNYSSDYISASTFRSAWGGGIPATVGVANKFLLLWK